MTIYDAAINLESVALNFIGGTIFLVGTVERKTYDTIGKSIKK
jgi:hypothetical protein